MKKRNIVHSALSLSLTAALCLSMAACGGTQPPADSSAASAAPAQPAAVHRRRQTVLPLRSPLPRPPWCSPLLRRRPLRRCR